MRLLIFISILFLSVPALAQDSLAYHKADSLLKSGAKVVSHSDTAIHRLDSLKGKVNKVTNKLQLPKASLPDSLDPAKKLQGVSNSVGTRLKSMSRVDSLFAFNHELRKVDSLKLAFQKKSDEIKNKARRAPKKIKRSLDSLQKEYNTRASGLAKKFASKNKELLAGHEKELSGKLDMNTPAISSLFPSMDVNSKIPGNSLGLNGTPGIPSVPSAAGVGNFSTPNANLPNTSLNTDVINTPAKDLQQGSNELKKIEKEGEAYTKQLQQLKKDSLANLKQGEKWTEGQIQGRSEIKALKDKQLELQKQQKLQQEYLKKVAEYQSPKKIEEEIKKNAAKVVNSDVVTKQPQFQDAQKAMAKAKKKYGEFQSIKNLPKRPLNPMSELSFRERFYPGLFLQVLNGKFYSIDFAPQAYYKITTRFDVGAGFIYRLNVDFNKGSLVQNHDLFGFKLFSNFKIYKSFYFRLEGERINHQVPIAVNSDITSFRWTNTLLGGIGKEFNISKKIRGNTLVLYNILDSYDSPYGSKFLFRFGFNLSLKKDQRREFIRSLK